MTGEAVRFSWKSPSKVLSELPALVKKHPSGYVGMVDAVTPPTYIRRLFPRFPEVLPYADIAYEVRTKLSFEQLAVLRCAGVTRVQAGIESLSSSLLVRMRKGTNARQNIAFLRNARCLGITVSWNMLYGFPGDTRDEYVEVITRASIMKHLDAPALTPLSIQRFSDYHQRPSEHGISAVRPREVYRSFLPVHADVDKLAYYFSADFDCFARSDELLISELRELVEDWSAHKSNRQRPRLELVQGSSQRHLLVDTRGLKDCREIESVSTHQAVAALVNVPISLDVVSDSERRWAINRRLLIESDGWYVSLVCAEPALYKEIIQAATHMQHSSAESLTALKID